ncbi:MAG TPA: Uma2 family endonuclease [Kofleriaceae bacterium]|nr:Uma2 family endonuclease [Kofleriaceae bacterium]
MFGAVARPAIEPELFRPLKRSEYDRMVELGLFQDERVELLRGVLVKMSPQYAPHASTIEKLTELLVMRLQGRFRVRIQSPLALSDDSEPEPDVAIVPRGDYETEHPRTALLVIEVSDSSLQKDRGKAEIYASAGIGEYWLVNLGARTVEVYSSPEGDRYAEAHTLREGATLRPTALPDVSIAVAEILPKA